MRLWSRDVLGGAALVCMGLFAAFYALATLKLGTISQMGPGMFPLGVGVILAALGLSIAIGGALRGGGTMQEVDPRSFVAVLLSIFAFAVTVMPLGMIPAIVVLTFVASRADSRLSLLGTALLAVALSVMAYLIFRVGLGVPLRPFVWP